MNPSALKVLVSAIVLTTLWFDPMSVWAGPPVGLIDFNSNGGDFTVVNTNNPLGPWSYDADTGSWQAHDTNDYAIPFRSSRLNSPILTVPVAGGVVLTFTHRYSFEADDTRWDGGQLRISVNQGPYVAVPSSSFSANGYNNTVGGAAVPNSELAGQEAFTAQSSGYDTPEFITSVATLGTFNQNDTISIQFLAAWDDGVQGMVPNWEIDSVEFTPPLEDRRPPPSFSDPGLPADAAVVELTSHTLHSVPVDYVSLQWFKDGIAIPTATSSNYTIGKMRAADAGQYFVQAISSVGTTTSRVATITYIPDTTAPMLLSAEWCLEGEQIIIGLSEPLQLDNGQGYLVTDQFTWFIERLTGPGLDPGQPATVNYVPGDTTIFMRPEVGSMDPLATYRVVLVLDMIDEAEVPNTLPADSSVPIVCPQAISVGPTGAGPFAFDRQPRVKQFSTFTWAGGANGIADNAGVVDGRVQLLNASAINVALAPAAGAPPVATGMAQWSSEGKYLITRPTSVAGCVVMATLRNDSGQTLRSLGISYDLKSESPLAEEVPGHLVYYSVSGAPNTWLQIPGISGDGSTGPKTALLDLSDYEWTVGSILYILWADDNGSGSPDGANEIDNFSVSLVRPKLSISYSSPNVTVTWPAGSGILQSKASLSDPLWTDVPGAGSNGSATMAAGGSRKFFTLRAP